ncbi:remorin 4.1-like [Cornus florida]|uniref:remorin 4.1-like n=1 Tax=Cornus florida TaxID=4283 RepID=UPI0028995AC8|nr:remorin 4.1-like [Cornus florida]
MFNDQRAITSREDHERDHVDVHIRDIHALTPPQPVNISTGRQRESWERSSSLSMGSEGSENFTSMSREFNALVVAGSNNIGSNNINNNNDDVYEGTGNLAMIGEDELMVEETNPLAIVRDNNPLDPVGSPRRATTTTTTAGGFSSMVGGGYGTEVSAHRVKKEEVESKISAWQTAKIAKINNRFKREDAIINGWESEQVQKSTSWMKKVERKLEEKRARAMEKMQNEVAKAHRKAEERRASAEAKRGTKVARVLEISNLMRAVGRPPVKRSFF